MIEYLSTYLTSPKLTPKAALIFYKTPCIGRDEAYVEIREIDSQTGRMKSGKPLSKKGLEELTRVYDNTPESLLSGTIPSRLLWCDPRNEIFIWYNKPGKHRMEFSKNVKLDTGEYYMPGVVFMSRKDTLYAYAFKGKKPSPATRLLHGPFFNTYAACHICTGTARHQIEGPPSFEKTLEHFETIFWNSENSHPIFWHTDKDQPLELDKAVAKYKDIPFDTSILKPTKLKLRNLFEGNLHAD